MTKSLSLLNPNKNEESILFMINKYNIKTDTKFNIVNFNKRSEFILYVNKVINEIPNNIIRAYQIYNPNCVVKDYISLINKVLEFNNFINKYHDFIELSKQHLINLIFTYKYIKDQIISSGYSRLSIIRYFSFKDEILEDIFKINENIYKYKNRINMYHILELMSFYEIKYPACKNLQHLYLNFINCDITVNIV